MTTMPSSVLPPLPPFPLLAAFAALAIPACAPSVDRAPVEERVGVEASALTIPGLFASGVDDKGVLLGNGVVDTHYALSSSDPALPGRRSPLRPHGMPPAGPETHSLACSPRRSTSAARCVAWRLQLSPAGR